MRRFLVDTVVLATSVALAMYFVRIDAVHLLVSWTGGGVVVASFLGGAFFTSVFTAAPATVLLGQLMLHVPLWQVALVGAVGATAVDYAMFLFFSRRLGHHAKALANHRRFEFVRRALAHSKLRFVLSVVGAVVIASPLPDELGLMLLGVSSVRRRTVLVLSFVLNAAGILAVGLAARALA